MVFLGQVLNLVVNSLLSQVRAMQAGTVYEYNTGTIVKLYCIALYCTALHGLHRIASHCDDMIIYDSNNVLGFFFSRSQLVWPLELL